MLCVIDLHSLCFYMNRNLLAKMPNHDVHFRNYSILLSRSVAKPQRENRLSINLRKIVSLCANNCVGVFCLKYWRILVSLS